MKPIKPNQDTTVTVADNQIVITTITNHQQSIDQDTTIQIPISIITKIDIKSKVFWKIINRAALELRKNNPTPKQWELSMVASEIAIGLQHTMDE